MKRQSGFCSPPEEGPLKTRSTPASAGTQPC